MEATDSGVNVLKLVQAIASTRVALATHAQGILRGQNSAYRKYYKMIKVYSHVNPINTPLTLTLSYSYVTINYVYIQDNGGVMGPKGRGKANFSLVDLKDGSKPLTSRGNTTTPTAATITIGTKSSSSPGGEQLRTVKADELSTPSRGVDVPSTSLRRPSARPDANTSSKTVHARTHGLNGVARYDGTGKLAGGGRSSSSPGTAVETVQVAEEEADLNLFDTNFGTPGGPVFM